MGSLNLKHRVEAIPPEKLALLSNKQEGVTKIEGVKIDKLSVTFNLMTSDDYQNTLSLVIPDIAVWLPQYKPHPVAPKKEDIYKHSIRFTLPNGSVVFLQCDPKKLKSRFMRLEWNPGAVGPDGHVHLRALLKPFYASAPKNYFDHVLLHGSVTRLDLCVDMYGKPIRSLVIGGFPNRKRVLYVSKKGELESLYIGTSDNKIAVYDKVAESKAHAGFKKIKPSVADEPCTRVEARLNPKGITLGRLSEIENPFSKLTVYDLEVAWDGMCDNRSMHRLFVGTAQLSGIEKALDTITDEHIRKALRRMVRASRLSAFQTKADELWKPYLLALKAYGITQPKKDPAKGLST